MKGQPNIDARKLPELRKVFEDFLARGSTKDEAYRELGQTCSVSPRTVKYHLDPRFRASRLNSDHKRYKRKIHVRTYDRGYRKLRNHPEYLFGKVFEETEQACASEIASRLSEFTEGIIFRSSTVRKILTNYIDEGRGPPYIKEVEPGVYCRKAEEDVGVQMKQCDLY